jgi:hypothetical protein
MRQHPQVLSPETMAILAGSVNPNMAKNEQAGNPLEASTDTRNGSSALKTAGRGCFPIC